LIKNQKGIHISNSTFVNLNYGTLENSLASLLKDRNSLSQSTGIVLSINNFGGPVEFLHNNVSHNMVLFPDAIFSNSPRTNQTNNPNFGIEKFLSPQNEFQPAGAFLKIRKNSTRNVNDIVRIFNQMNPNMDNPKINSNYSSINPILLKNMQSDHIIFAGN
jgi:hypothetical protein